MVAGLRQLVDELFDKWSSGDPDQIQPLFHPDAFLWDSVNGGFKGWPAIRQLYVESLSRWDNLSCGVVRAWPEDTNSISFVWRTTAFVKGDRFGAEFRGAPCSFEGMAYIEFDNGLVMREIEYFDRGAPAQSLGFEVDRVIFRENQPKFSK